MSIVYREQDKIYHAAHCDPLVNAAKAHKVQFEALVRYHYPGRPLEENVLAGINSIGYWDASIPQDWGLDWHRNEGIELTFLETGSMPFSIESQDFQLTPNDLTITRPWQLHQVGDPAVGIGRLHWIIIDVGVRQPHQEWKWPDWVVLSKKDLEELTRMLRQNEQPVWKSNSDIRCCFQQLAQSVKTDQAGNNESRLKIYLNELFLHLLDLFRYGDIPLNESLTDSIRSVELFFAQLPASLQAPWTLEMMASQCGLGVTRLVHYCKQLTNKTPMNYLTSVRMECAAKKLLEDPHASVTSIAFDCGFSSSQYFANVFRRHFGYSPQAYRSGKNKPAEVNVVE